MAVPRRLIVFDSTVLFDKQRHLIGTDDVRPTATAFCCFGHSLDILNKDKHGMCRFLEIVGSPCAVGFVFSRSQPL